MDLQADDLLARNPAIKREQNRLLGFAQLNPTYEFRVLRASVVVFLMAIPGSRIGEGLAGFGDELPVVAI
jgi:hypothetical protein